MKEKTEIKIPSKLYLRVIGDPILVKKAHPVEYITDEIKEFGTKLIKMMFEFDGVGLAATQVGVPLRMIALAVPCPKCDKSKISIGEEVLCPKMPLLLINPKVTAIGTDCEIREEGCLSVPGIFAEVSRPSKVLFEGLINYEEKVSVECAGLLSRALQHEIDHLDGILFVNRLNKRSFKKIKPQLDEIYKNYAPKNFIRREK